jgi:hypothetical protein
MANQGVTSSGHRLTGPVPDLGVIGVRERGFSAWVRGLSCGRELRIQPTPGFEGWRKATRTMVARAVSGRPRVKGAGE